MENDVVVLVLKQPVPPPLTGIVTFSLSSSEKVRLWFLCCICKSEERKCALCGGEDEAKFPKQVILPSSAYIHHGITTVVGTFKSCLKYSRHTVIL